MKSSYVKKIRKDLNLPPGNWQLYRYGRLTQLPTLKVAIWIEAHFRQVELDETGIITRWGKTLEKREVPVGEMVAWDVGCVFDATSHKVSHPQKISEKVEQFTVDVSFSERNCSLFRLFDDNNLGSGIKQRHNAAHDEQNSNVYFVKATRESEIPLIIPCTTILKTFWGRSSNLIHMLLDSRFLDFQRYVVNPEKSVIDRVNRSAFIWLRQWSLDVDATFLATIAFDKLAITRGRNISLALQAEMDSSIESNQRYVMAYPPHQQPIKLTVLALPGENKDGEYLYIQRVLNSSYKPEFDSLVFDRDNDSRKVAQGQGEALPTVNSTAAKKPIRRPKQRAPRYEGSSEFVLAQDHPGLSATTETTNVGEFDPVFKGISIIVAEKLEQPTTEFENDEQSDVQGFQRWSNLLSTLPGTSQSSIAAIGTTLSSGEVLNDPMDTSIELAGYPLITLLSQLIQASESEYNDIKPINVLRMEVTPIFPWRAALAYDGRWMFPLPAEIDDYEWAWLYSDPSQLNRKRAVCLKVTFLGEGKTVLGVGYLIDAEGRFARTRNGESSKTSDDSPMLYVWEEREKTPATYFQDTKMLEKKLRQIILQLVSEGGSSAQIKARELKLEAEPRKHKRDGVKLKVLIGELFGLVSVTVL